MKLTRRKLLLAGLGASQVLLLDRFQGRSFAKPTANGPTKLLSIYIPGGIHHELFWAPFGAAAIQKYIPAPVGGSNPTFYNTDMVENWDGSGQADQDAKVRRVRGPVHWSWAAPETNSASADPKNPKSGGAQDYTPNGYAWAEPTYRIYENTAVIHGVNQGTAAHESGLVASLCGIAGANFAAPAVQAWVANAMASLFPDRPLTNVSIFGALDPPAVTLPGLASPIFINNAKSLDFMLSDKRDPAWAGLRTRSDVDDLAFDGASLGSKARLTAVDQQVLSALRRERGRSSKATDAALESLYDSYRGLSRTIAKDVVNILEKTPGVEHLPMNMPWSPGESQFGWRIGYADAVASDGTWAEEIEMTLKLLKSDLATSVTFRCNGLNQFNFDSHYANPFQPHSNNYRGVMEVIGRLLIEMKLSPSTLRPGKTLLDDTLVYIFSEFGRTFPSGGGSDHNPLTSAVLVGGEIKGNQMFGGFDETSLLGQPVDIIEESGEKGQRPPQASDVIATVLSAFGLEPGADFFLPGGYGVVAGVKG
jgi:hypothetical protein